jgi:integrase
VLVNLFRGVIGAPVRPDAVGDLLAAASRRAGLAAAVTPHQLRHAFGSNIADAGCGIDVVADLLGHASVSSSQVYLHQGSGIASDERGLRSLPGPDGGKCPSAQQQRQRFDQELRSDEPA